jgi:hypothetical protein
MDAGCSRRDGYALGVKGAPTSFLDGSAIRVLKLSRDYVLLSANIARRSCDLLKSKGA